MRFLPPVLNQSGSCNVVLRWLVTLATFLGSSAAAQSVDFVVDRLIPKEISNDRKDAPGDIVRTRLIKKDQSRLERLAEDRRMRELHQTAVRQRRVAIAEGSHVLTDAIPRIFSIVRLSDGTVLLAWEGSQNHYHSVGSHGDHNAEQPTGWQGSLSPVPMTGGVGEWSESYYERQHHAGQPGVDAAPLRYYAVHQYDDDYRPGPESEWISGTVSIREANGIPVEAIIRIVDGTPGSKPTVSSIIDGVDAGRLDAIDKNLYRLPLPIHSFLPGRYSLYMEMCDVWDDPSAQTGGGGHFRTPPTWFDIPANLPHHAVGFRLSWEVKPPDFVAVVAELAPHYGEWELTLHDNDGRKVRSWAGRTDQNQGTSLFIGLDERDGNGNLLPLKSGPYQARLTAESKWRGKSVKRCIGRLDMPTGFGG
jgi:hypothetical protein